MSRGSNVIGRNMAARRSDDELPSLNAKGKPRVVVGHNDWSTRISVAKSHGCCEQGSGNGKFHRGGSKKVVVPSWMTAIRRSSLRNRSSSDDSLDHRGTGDGDNGTSVDASETVPSSESSSQGGFKTKTLPKQERAIITNVSEPSSAHKLIPRKRRQSFGSFLLFWSSSTPLDSHESNFDREAAIVEKGKSAAERDEEACNVGPPVARTGRRRRSSPTMLLKDGEGNAKSSVYKGGNSSRRRFFGSLQFYRSASLPTTLASEEGNGRVPRRVSFTDCSNNFNDDLPEAGNKRTLRRNSSAGLQGSFSLRRGSNTSSPRSSFGSKSPVSRRRSSSRSSFKMAEGFNSHCGLLPPDFVDLDDDDDDDDNGCSPKGAPVDSHHDLETIQGNGPGANNEETDQQHYFDEGIQALRYLIETDAPVQYVTDLLHSNPNLLDKRALADHQVRSQWLYKKNPLELLQDRMVCSCGKCNWNRRSVLKALSNGADYYRQECKGAEPSEAIKSPCDHENGNDDSSDRVMVDPDDDYTKMDHKLCNWKITWDEGHDTKVDTPKSDSNRSEAGLFAPLTEHNLAERDVLVSNLFFERERLWNTYRSDLANLQSKIDELNNEKHIADEVLKEKVERIRMLQQRLKDLDSSSSLQRRRSSLPRKGGITALKNVVNSGQRNFFSSGIVNTDSSDYYATDSRARLEYELGIATIDLTSFEKDHMGLLREIISMEKLHRNVRKELFGGIEKILGSMLGTEGLARDCSEFL